MTLICRNATEWVGSADLVLTNPYAPLPPCLRGVPSLISNFAERKELCEAYVGAPLVEVSAWSRGLRNRVWAANLPVKPVDLTDLVEDEFEPGRGWFPEELPRRLLSAYRWAGLVTVWDGFMGRGTVGKACAELGLDFVGIDINPQRVALAREYLA